jgi:3-oxoacyl-[acyl-carrier-protein] synthase II
VVMPVGPSESRRREIVVTGLGAVTPAGNTCDELWSVLECGRSGIRRRSGDAARAGPIAWAGEALSFTGQMADFGALEPETAKQLRKILKLMNRETRMGVAAGQQALSDSGLLCSETDRERIGVCLGADNVSLLPDDFVSAVAACSDAEGQFEFSRWGQDGIAHVAPLWLLRCLPNMPACYLGMLNELRGPNNTITEGSVSANLAVAEACAWIEQGAADAVLVGATSTMLAPFNLVHALADVDVATVDSTDEVDPSRVCRPFDRERRGTVLAEGAAAFVLETADSARRRGARIYGQVIGTASGCASGSGPGMAAALEQALHLCLERAALEPQDVGHIHAFGLGARRADAEEAQAVRRAFGPAADRVPLVTVKSSLGHAGAGAGAIQVAASLLALREQRLFRVLNYEAPDPDCPVRPVTEGCTPAGSSFLSYSLSPDGLASCVVLRAA